MRPTQLFWGASSGSDRNGQAPGSAGGSRTVPGMPIRGHRRSLIKAGVCQRSGRDPESGE